MLKDDHTIFYSGLHKSRQSGFWYLINLITIPNQLSGIRLVLIPILWVVAFIEQPFYIGIGIIIAGLTDYLDGMTARKFNQVTGLGGKLDTLADYMFYISVFFWILVLIPEIFLDHPVLILTWAITNLLSLLVGWQKYRTFSTRQFYSVKVSIIIGYAYTGYAFMYGYNQGLFYLIIGFLILSSIESLVLQVINQKNDIPLKSLVFVSEKFNEKSD